MKKNRMLVLVSLIGAAQTFAAGPSGLVAPEQLSGLDLLSDSRVSFAPGVSPELDGTALILRGGVGRVAPLMSIRLAEASDVPEDFEMRACMRMTRRGGDWDPGFGIGDLSGVASIVFADNFNGIANSQDWVFPGGGAGCSTSGSDCPTNSDRILTGAGYPAIGATADFGARWTVERGRVTAAGAELSGAENEIAVDLPVSDANGLDLVFVANDDGELYEIHNVRLGVACSEPINRAPVASAGADQTVECADATTTRVTLNGLLSEDPDNDALDFSWTGPFPEGGGTLAGPVVAVTLPNGTHEVSLTVRDPSGAEGHDSTRITIEDTTAPEIRGIAPSVTELWPANHKMRPIEVSVDVSDSCGQSNCRVSNVTSNEANDSTGDGTTSPDWIVIEPLSVSLRAERDGSGTGRIYTIHLECTDQAGNRSVSSVDVRVPRSRRIK